MDDNRLLAIRLASKEQRLSPHLIPTLPDPKWLLLAWLIWTSGDDLFHAAACVGCVLVFSYELVTAYFEIVSKRLVIPAEVIDFDERG
jgi:hypothetical protein